MRAYPADLRERMAAVKRGMSRAQVAADLKVLLSSVERYPSRRCKSGVLAPSAPGHRPRPVKKGLLPVAIGRRGSYGPQRS